MNAVEIARERKQKLLELTRSAVGKERAGYGDDARLVKDLIPINVLGVDEILGGGFRKGRMAMITGQESMGKTLFTQWVICAFQRAGEVCAFIDPEKTFDPEWFCKTGVNVGDLLVVQPSSTEQAFDTACMWAENGVGLIVIDSLAALTPKARLDAGLEEQEFVGLLPRKLSEGLNKFTNINTDSLLVCTNQLRSKIGTVYGSPDEIPGGRAQKFYASYIVQIKRKGWLTEGDERVGYNMLVKTEKNKLAPPFQETTVPFLYTGLVDTLGNSIELALDLGLIVRKGPYYTWKETKFKGRTNLLQFFRENETELDELKEMIKFGDGEIDFSS